MRVGIIGFQLDAFRIDPSQMRVGISGFQFDEKAAKGLINRPRLRF